MTCLSLSRRDAAILVVLIPLLAGTYVYMEHFFIVERDPALRQLEGRIERCEWRTIRLRKDRGAVFLTLAHQHPRPLRLRPGEQAAILRDLCQRAAHVSLEYSSVRRRDREERDYWIQSLSAGATSVIRASDIESRRAANERWGIGLALASGALWLYALSRLNPFSRPAS